MISLEKNILKTKGKITALFLVVTLINIVFLPLLHEHKNACCTDSCDVQSEQTTPTHNDNQSDDDCNVCKFINTHSIISISISFDIDFYPPDKSDYFIFTQQDVEEYAVSHSNKDPPDC